jgi:hypothetical protein
MSGMYSYHSFLFNNFMCSTFLDIQKNIDTLFYIKDTALRRYELQFRQSICLKIATSHSTYLEEVFWRNVMYHRESCRFIMNYNLPSSIIWSVLPFLRTLLSKGDTILIDKYNYHIQKSFLKPILAWRLKT